MKYDVIQKIGGNTTVVATWEDNLAKAKQSFFNQASLLYAEASVESGVVGLYDDNMDIVDGCKEIIKKN